MDNLDFEENIIVSSRSNHQTLAKSTNDEIQALIDVQKQLKDKKEVLYTHTADDGPDTDTAVLYN